MAFADDPTDPANMTVDERVAEVAAILAEGVLRLRSRGIIHAVESVDSAANVLADPSETRLDGQRG